MLYNIFSMRAIQIGVAFFLIVVGGSLLYSWHVERGIQAEKARTEKFRRQQETHSGKSSSTQNVESPHIDIVEEMDAPTTEAPHAHHIVSEEREVLSADDTDMTARRDVLESPLKAEVPEQADFKTTPDGYPMTPYWDYPEDEQNEWDYEHKLIDHVLVKLWQQGTRDFVGGSIEDGTGRVRPHYLNTLYVQWEEVEDPNGSMVKIITRALGAGDVNWQQKGPFDLPPPEVHLIDINSTEGEGIDPFTFLTSEELPK